MRTHDAHQKDLAELFAIYLSSGDRVRLVEYLVTHSNLPGPRGNLELPAASPQRVDRALTDLRRLADDSRWRMREAVAMALQPLLRHHPQKTLARLKNWIAGEHWLGMWGA